MITINLCNETHKYSEKNDVGTVHGKTSLVTRGWSYIIRLYNVRTRNNLKNLLFHVFFFFSEEKKNRHSKIKLFISRSQHYFVFVELKSEIQVSFLSGW